MTTLMQSRENLRAMYPNQPGKVLGTTIGQIAVSLIFGVLLPLGLLSLFQPDDYLMAPNVRLTASAAAIATIFAIFLLRRLVLYPGISHSAMILPILSSAFGLAVIVVLVARAPYSNLVLIVNFSCVLAVQFAIGSRHAAREPLRHLLIRGGNIDRLTSALDENCQWWNAPSDRVPRGAVVVADLRFDHSDEWEERLADVALQGIPVYHYKQVLETITGKVRIEHLSENHFGSLVPSYGYTNIKRVADFFLAIVAGLLLAPLFVSVALAIKLDSTGPIFFRQTRVGYRGQRFRVLKFRTMKVLKEENRDKKLAAMTVDNDPRITPIGRFLRTSRIDELPQIWNIIRGEMSWIGPRPEALELSEWYKQEVPFYAYRHIVRPGITGWAQINQGHVTTIDDIHAKLEFDFFYIKNFSYWLDFIITLRTIHVMLTGFGAK